MSEPIHGTKLAEIIREKAKERVDAMKTHPGLAAILVGDDPASHLYVKLKEKAAREVGIYFEVLEFSANVKTKTLLEAVHKLNKRDDIHGILVQLPLPNQDEDAVIDAIEPLKDIDGFHAESQRRLEQGEPGLVPPVALAVVKLISDTRQPLAGKHAVIVSNNPIFAGPIIELMKESQIEAIYVSPDDSAADAKIRAADIIVIAIGREQWLTKDKVKEGAILIDVGANKTPDGAVVGDVHADARDHAAFISPVPGGVGPLTVAYLMMNVIKAKQLQGLE
jgi:methylenetetrahydrofolate dehydrogenase (NADP+)/methenyltetrahydrofolate cyclohydrolase